MGCSDILMQYFHSAIDIYIETSVYIYHMYTRPCIKHYEMNKCDEDEDDVKEIS